MKQRDAHFKIYDNVIILQRLNFLSMHDNRVIHLNNVLHK